MSGEMKHTPPTLDWVSVPSHIAEGPAEVRHKDGWLVCEVPSDEYSRLIAAAPDMREALIAAKKEMWLSARHQWTMADFKNWAVVQQVDAALEKADGKLRTDTLADKAGA